ncbi:MAG: dephospho-CoA kinase [Rhodopirellula sp.]|nr:dephospho-CoA kinase [Rhodopirellula sp.]|tara:strand:- start:996 stop:1625 length:630 start_codon:yes stop_codon:yes gene_type:complete
MIKQTVICGICGGIGSGKTYIAQQFQLFGAAVFNADHVGHRVLLHDDVKACLVERWGNAILDEASEIDRSKVAALVFAQTTQAQRDREFLQAVTHPLIEQELEAFIANSDSEVVIIDAALLLETGWQSVCHQIIFVDALAHVRLNRCQQRGWAEDQFRSREAAQWSLEQKRSRADFVIDNNGDVKRTTEMIGKVWQALSTSGSLAREQV